MPFAAFACRITAWFVLGAGLAGAAFFARYDGLGLALSAGIAVSAVAAAVGLWALGRVCREVARLAKHIDPKPTKTSAARAKASPAPKEPPTTRWRRKARPAGDDTELAEFFS